jgi:hypothetical protein
MAAECNPIPPCFELPPVEHLASQVLPAIPTYTTQAVFTFPTTGVQRVCFWITYTRGADGGFPSFRVQFQDGDGNSYRAMIHDKTTITVVQPEGDVNVYQETLDGPQPADDTAVRYYLEFTVPAAATAVRLQMA